MKTQFVIEQKTLKAISHFSATKDIRYYLEGIKIEFSPHFTRAIATNGHVLGMRQEKREGENDGTGELIIPNDIVAYICKLKTTYREAKADIVFTSTETAGEWTHHSNGELPVLPMTFKQLNGVFPDYQRIALSHLPDLNEPESAATFDPLHLKTIYDAARVIHGHSKEKIPHLRIRHDYRRASVFTDGDLFAILMPLMQAPIDAYPEWAMRSVKDQESDIVFAQIAWANGKAQREQLAQAA